MFHFSNFLCHWRVIRPCVSELKLWFWLFAAFGDSFALLILEPSFWVPSGPSLHHSWRKAIIAWLQAFKWGFLQHHNFLKCLICIMTIRMVYPDRLSGPNVGTCNSMNSNGTCLKRLQTQYKRTSLFAQVNRLEAATISAKGAQRRILCLQA